MGASPYTGIQIAMERLYQPPLPGLATAIGIAANTAAFLAEDLEKAPARAERACFDRYLLILDALERRSLFDTSLLDIGCANGFFAYLFALTMCRQVTAVEDMRGASAGYSENAFLNPLLQIRLENGVSHLEIIDAPLEEFLTTCPDRQWDVVLCLSVLHHFYTGYGDNPEVGLLHEEARRSLFAAIGRATGSILYLEFDHGRVPESFLSEFENIGGFAGKRVIGSSSSAVGQTRDLYELWK
jgi:SAM-dependent methyltransferase